MRRPLVRLRGTGDPRSSGGGRVALPHAGDRHPRAVPGRCRSSWRRGSASRTGTGTAARSAAHVHCVGLDNYRHLLTTPGLDQSNFGTSLRNNVYYVLLVVPIQTAVALFLAVLVNRALRGVGFFRTAFYFPSVTSSVAITVLFLFLFDPTGVRSTSSCRTWASRAGVALRPARPLPRHPRRSSASTSRRPRSRTGCSSASAIGTGCRPEHRHVRVHHDGRLHHLGHIHAASSSLRCRASTSRSTRRRRWTAPPSGGSSGTSPSR